MDPQPIYSVRSSSMNLGDTAKQQRDSTLNPSLREGLNQQYLMQFNQKDSCPASYPMITASEDPASYASLVGGPLSPLRKVESSEQTISNTNHHSRYHGAESPIYSAGQKESTFSSSATSHDSTKSGIFHYFTSLDMKKSRIVLLMFLIGLLIAVPTFAFLDYKRGVEKFNESNYVLSPLDINQDIFDGLSAKCNVTFVDIPNNQFKMTFDVYPLGKYVLESSSKNKRLARNVTLVAGSQNFNFRAGQPIPSLSLNLPFSSGNINKYPFDQYEGEFVIDAFESNNPESNMLISFRIAPLTFGFNFEPIQVYTDDDQFINISMVANRSFTVRFFSLFIIGCMWCLSLIAFTLACTLWLRNRKAEPPTIGFIAGLLFAMPAIRNSQPNAPSIGCTADVAGFFWNMALVLISACLLMVNYIKKNQRDEPRRSKQA